MKNVLRWVHRSERRPDSREGDKPLRTPDKEIWLWLERAGLPRLAIPGLLCHLLIFWLLFFPYTYWYSPYGSADGFTRITTGWQAMGFILLLPVFPYLLCLLPTLWKGERRKKWFATGLSLNSLVNVGGFLLMYALLQLSRLADLHYSSWLDAAYGIHLTILLLAVICSSVNSLLLGSLLRRSRILG